MSDYVIHKSGKGWYRPDACGYTFIASEAGLYSLQDAIDYTHPNGPDGPRDGLTYKLKSSVEAPSTCSDEATIFDLKRQVSDLTDAKEKLSSELSSALAKIEALEAEASGVESALSIMEYMR